MRAKPTARMDFIRFRRSGQRAIDMADAFATGLFDVRAMNWSLPTLTALGICPEWPPRAFKSAEIFGVVGQDGAAATGLKAGTPIKRPRPSASASFRRSGEGIAPEPANVALYESRYWIFRDLYPATRTLMHQLVAET